MMVISKMKLYLVTCCSVQLLCGRLHIDLCVDTLASILSERWDGDKQRKDFNS